MKIEENEMKNVLKRFFHIPPVQRFHGNYFHNTVTVESACGAAYVFFDKVVATQKKAKRGYREKRKEKERKEKRLQKEIRGWVTRGK